MFYFLELSKQIPLPVVVQIDHPAIPGQEETLAGEIVVHGQYRPVKAGQFQLGDAIFLRKIVVLRIAADQLVQQGSGQAGKERRYQRRSSPQACDPSGSDMRWYTSYCSGASKDKEKRM